MNNRLKVICFFSILYVFTLTGCDENTILTNNFNENYEDIQKDNHEEKDLKIAILKQNQFREKVFQLVREYEDNMHDTEKQEEIKKELDTISARVKSHYLANFK